MFTLQIQSVFSATHAIMIAGQPEPVHGHDWHVRLRVSGPELDQDGLLCDFHVLESSLRDVLAPLHHVDLNTTPPFDQVNPTAEHVAAHIGQLLAPLMPESVHHIEVIVTEAPGCEASFCMAMKA